MKNFTLNPKSILWLLLSVIIVYLCLFIYEVVKYGHSFDSEYSKNYLWLFSDSSKKTIDNRFSYSCIGSRDVYSIFHMKNLTVTVWDFKDLKHFSSTNFRIFKAKNLFQYNITSGEVLDSKSDIPVSIEFGAELNKMSAFYDEHSKSIKKFENTNYKGFYGIVNKVSLNDEFGKAKIVISYAKNSANVLLLYYNSSKGSFIIIVDSKEPIDETVLKIFNFEND